MQRKRSRAALLQYALMAILVVVLIFLLYQKASPGVFTLVFLVGVIVAALPSILARKGRFPTKVNEPADIEAQPRLQQAIVAEREEIRPWSIRPLTDDDLIEVAALLRIAFEEYRGLLDPASGAHNETSEQLRLVLKDSRALVAVLKEHDSANEDAGEPGRIVGCVFYQFIIDHVYLFRLAVLPEYRRQGIARALIEQVEEITRLAGVGWVQLGVRTQLPKNQLYYEKQGYRFLRFETHKDYQSPTVVILQKKV